MSQDVRQQSPLSAMDHAMTTFPQGQVLKGQYLRPWRSSKGKIKGLELQAGNTLYAIKLPKYLRPMLAWEVEPQAFVQVWAYPDDDIWRAINLLPLPEAEVAALQQQRSSDPPQGAENENAAKARSGEDKPLCIQVCRKGKCYKQGGQHIWKILQSEVESNPDLQHISIEATGCMKACKKGPNVRVLPKGKMLNRVTPDHALTVLENCQ